MSGLWHGQNTSVRVSPGMPTKKLLSAKAVAPFFVSSALFISLLLSACGDSAQPVTPSPVSAGEAVYKRYCNSCHPGGARGAGPSLIELAPGLSDEQLRAVVRNGKTRMPAYGPSTISDEQLTELVAYIRTLK